MVPPAPTRTPGPCGRSAHEHTLVGERPVGRQLGVGLGDDVLLFLVSRQVDDLVGHLALGDPPVRRLDEAVLVYPAVSSQVADEADVRALRGLDRAHPAVVGAVDVTDFEPGPLPATGHRGPWPKGVACGSGRKAGWSGP